MLENIASSKNNPGGGQPPQSFLSSASSASAVLSRWAKMGMMLQSLISLTIVVLLAARAVNIL